MDPSYDPVAGGAHRNHNPSTLPSNASSLPAGGSTETAASSMLNLFLKLAYGEGKSRASGVHDDIIDIVRFVGLVCLRFSEDSEERKRSFLLSRLDENDQIRAAAALLDTSTTARGQPRKDILARLQRNITSTLDAFGRWTSSWGAVLTGYTSNEVAVRSLSEESKTHFVHDWQRALVFVFGELPELWRLPTVSSDLGTVPFNPAPRTDLGKGIAIEIFNNIGPATPQVVRPEFRRIAFRELKTPESVRSELQAKETKLQRSRLGIAATPPAQPRPAGNVPSSSSLSPSSLTMHGGEQPRVVHPTLPFSAAPTPSVSATPTLPFSAAPTLPFSAAPTLPFPAGSTSAVSPSHLRGSGSSSPLNTRPSATTGRPSLLSNFDLTALAEDLETSTRFPIDELGDFADAIVRLARGVPISTSTGQGLPSNLFNVTAHNAPAMSEHFRRWSFLVREYLNIKEVQVDELWKAARYIRQWHSVYLNLKLYLYGQGIEIPADVQVQAERMLKLTHTLTVLVIVRRGQLRPQHAH